ncbi:hypothetical protein I545_2586 [Mycobacterium kansasii 662]|uniref:Uncharacterized protein n=1 Tax=Mycobacterium kansasii 662 TaxID=1299326 RepID=X7ZGD9_MYCKA|nr:hypothetical protein I545_2586 [Mycobacterium kansasii 662]
MGLRLVCMDRAFGVVPAGPGSVPAGRHRAWTGGNHRLP